MRRKKIEEEVEKTLQALDDHQPIEANPYFMTRLMQRIENEKAEAEAEAEAAKLNFKWSKVWQPALFAMLIVVNLFTFYNLSSNTNENDTGVSVLAKEYNYNNSDASMDYASGIQQ